MKRLAIGVSDFKKIIEGDFYYFDKTKFIEEIIKDGSEVKLFARPRRFGKTLNMSMLKYFFDIENKEENKEIFKNLYIEKTEAFKEQGQYPVIFLSLKDLKALTWEQMEKAIKSTISRLFSEYKYLLNDLDKFDTLTFENILLKNTELEDLKEALKFLTRILYEKYNKKVVVLIDEYDSPLVSAYINGYYEKAKDFFKTFYSSVLKDNSYLQMGVLTGIIRVIKAGIFSDLNNLKVYSILEKEYSDFYGFTQEEVEKALKNFNIEYELPEVKAWYDGYRFGNSDVYNPWSILNFIQSEELRPYWIETSGNFLINNILKNVSTETIEILENLFNGISVEENISGNSDLSVLMGEDEIWELLLFSGYLTIDEKIGESYEDIYTLRLPNREVKEFFRKKFIDVNFGESTFRKSMEALKKNNIKDFEKYLQNILLKSTSFHDTKSEIFYHGLILGMMFYLDRDYIVKSNEESGLGRYDVSIEPRNKNNRAYILEFKVTKNEEDLEKESKEAIEQIISKKYDVSLKERGLKEIVFLGIAFCGKLLKVNYR